MPHQRDPKTLPTSSGDELTKMFEPWLNSANGPFLGCTSLSLVAVSAVVINLLWKLDLLDTAN
jgi:hypothetical protein